MKKQFLFIVLMILITMTCISQSIDRADTVKGSLMHLKYQRRFVPKYVNFDVLKIMFSRGSSLQGGNNYGIGPSLNIQILDPWPFFKTAFPIAIGVNIGYAKMSLLKSKLVFTGNELTAIVKDENVSSSMQRTGYVGLVLLRAIRLYSFTILFGGSVNYNTVGRIRITTNGDKVKSNDISKINKLSLPVNIQISHSPRQLWSLGIFYSYDFTARFKGETFNNLRQINTGFSFAVIL